MAAINIPQTIFENMLGFGVPLDVILAIMKVAESADVIKKIKMSAIPINEAINVNGN